MGHGAWGMGLGQPGWSCNLGGRGGCNGKETRQTSSEKKLEDVIVKETRRKPQSSRPFSAAGTLKVIPVNRSRGCHTVRTALGTSVSLSMSARPCASVRQLSRLAHQTLVRDIVRAHRLRTPSALSRAFTRPSNRIQHSPSTASLRPPLCLRPPCRRTRHPVLVRDIVRAHVVRVGWSCNLGGRATWVVVQPGWSCNLGGRATWVVVQPGWSCNLGGRATRPSNRIQHSPSTAPLRPPLCLRPPALPSGAPGLGTWHCPRSRSPAA